MLIKAIISCCIENHEYSTLFKVSAYPIKAFLFHIGNKYDCIKITNKLKYYIVTFKAQMIILRHKLHYINGSIHNSNVLDIFKTKYRKCKNEVVNILK